VTSGLLLQAAVSGILLGGVYGLVASGLTLIFGVLRIINFAHGAVMMLAMYASYWLFVLYGVDPYASVLITAPLFFAIGAGIEKALIEPNRAAAEHNQLLLTLGLALFIENLALVLWQGDFRTLRVPYANASFVIGEALVELPRLIAAAGAVLMAVALFAFLRLTDLGKAIRALAEEPEGAMLVGIDVARIRATAFGIGAACAAVAGALITPFFYVAPDVGRVVQHHGLRRRRARRHGQLRRRAPRRAHRGPGRVARRGAPARLAQAARGVRHLRPRPPLPAPGAVRRIAWPLTRPAAGGASSPPCWCSDSAC
jgi:branched-chain amino acid transport system permease protein